VDLGWPGIREAFEKAFENPPGSLRSGLNDVITMAGSARDFVSWYEQALAGAFFSKPETLTEFKRIQATSVQIPLAVPPDTPAYAKGGEIPSLGPPPHAKSFAGQMVAESDSSTPVTFCFIVNWNGHVGDYSDFLAVEAEFFAAIKGILRVVKRDLQ
jgi:beta-lactamase class A